ncbi:MAG: VIT domain-containing protein [Bryobacteraceae bacterium]
MNRCPAVRFLIALLLAAPGLIRADAGVLIPSTARQPDPAILALDEMFIDVVIDNGHARVLVRQIFGNRKGAILEGNYIFALPSRAILSDFAVWDDATRIPGVILERKRAEELYNDIRAQAIDPGLLQMGERDADEARRSAIFSARIAPIPAWGTKRVEIEYQERLAVEQLEGFFAIPLRPDVYRAQTAGRLTMNLEVRSKHPMRDFQILSNAYPLQIGERTPNLVKATFEGRNVAFTEDFSLKYALDGSKGDSLEVLAYREGSGPGFFEASALLSNPANAPAAAPRTVIALFDTSLSMQWEKLERSFQALETLLRGLRPADQFNLLLYATEVTPLSPAPQPATPEHIEKALTFLKSSRLRGATNLQGALDAALAQSGPDPYLVLLGDGGATRGLVNSGKLAEWYATKWKQKPEAQRPRTYVFGVGDDANLPLLKMLARNNGIFEWVRSTEPIEFKLNAFLSKIGRKPVDGLQLAVTPASNIDLVYPLQDAAFSGTVASWLGQYKQPGTAQFAVKQMRVSANLPAQDTAHPYLPRDWAKARVDALLEKIERDGEDAATIDEIIRLSRKYKFVTPYTSFLAAPRALLRPRLIRPGDPVLRVKTDESITSVVAMFPFGLVKKLRFLEGEDTWQTRFLAPTDMTDGTYPVRLILRDKQGRVYKESKTFVIASKPPVVRVQLDKARYKRGEAIQFRVGASQSTRTITARLYGTSPVHLHWNPQANSNTGQMVVPTHLAAGSYKVTVTAEDFAHNIGTQEVTLEVLP